MICYCLLIDKNNEHVLFLYQSYESHLITTLNFFSCLHFFPFLFFLPHFPLFSSSLFSPKTPSPEWNLARKMIRESFIEKLKEVEKERDKEKEGRVNAEEELKRTKKIVIDTLLHPYFEL